jgi:hypothetical protein
VHQILATALPTAASIVKYKNQATTFINKRPFARDNLLSLDDNLRVTDLEVKKDGKVGIDWDNPNKPQYRDTIDGRYFILRQVSKKGEESFKIVFKGESFETVNGKQVHEIPISEIGTVSDLTMAQVMIRFFDDDVMRVKKAAELIEGGQGKFDPLRVGDKFVPIESPNQPLLASWSKADLFSEKVLEMYRENRGKPHFDQQIADALEGIGQYGEMVYLKWSANGKDFEREMVITPKQEGIITKYFDKGVNMDGQTVYTRKPKQNTQVTPDTPVDQNSANLNNAMPEDAGTPDRVETKLADATTFRVTQSKEPTPDNNSRDWTVLTNRLGYTIIKLEQGKFRVFNPASIFMAEVYEEIEAAEEILKDALKDENE